MVHFLIYNRRGFFNIAILIAIAAVLILGGVGVYVANKNRGNTTACTMEAMQCPNGSYVGRTGPKCEFAPCPSGNTKNNQSIRTFEECQAAGNAVGESYPRQCWTKDGKRFVEEIKQAAFTKQIDTGRGALILSYKDGKSTLSGTLQRSVPCVAWTTKITSTRDFPASHVNINIFDKNKGVICVQVLGEPQEVTWELDQVSKDAQYVISFEDKIVFEGKLNE